MKRREFIKKAGLATAGSIIVPYILPTGRLFASTGGVPLAPHVVLVMMAGGMRYQDSVGQKYLKGSQHPFQPNTLPAQELDRLNIEGNIMYNLFEGQSPIQLTGTGGNTANPKIIYGTDGGSLEIPRIFAQGNTMQKQGVFYKKIKSTSPGHYTGLNVLLQGNTMLSQGLKQRPLYPTVFEYARKYRGLNATDVWFVGYGIGNSIPLLSYSEHPDWGAKYGANFLVPYVLFGDKKGIGTTLGEKYLKSAKSYTHDQYDRIYGIKNFLDQTFEQAGITYTDIGNTQAEKDKIKEFMDEMFAKTFSQISFPYSHNYMSGGLNIDTVAIGYTIEVMKKFQPKLTVVNMQAIDGAHQSFSGAQKALHIADHSVAHLWNFIQNDPTFKDNTIMIVVPECGRNAQPNALVDQGNYYGYDHSDANTEDVFAMIVGPQNNTSWAQGAPLGHTVDYSTTNNNQTADVVHTLAHIMGIESDVLTANNGSKFFYTDSASLLSPQKMQ